MPGGKRTFAVLIALLVAAVYAPGSLPANNKEQRMSSEKELSLSKIGQIAVRVHDIDRAVEFYEKTLGMNLLFKLDSMAFFDCSGVRLMLSKPEAPEFDHPGSIIYYQVQDINASYQILKERGVTFRDDPHMIADMGDHELWMAFFKDVDENVLALMSEVPK